MKTPTSPPELSVVIVSWNTKSLLLRCLESLKAEAARSRLNVEAFVVDNASSDGTTSAVAEHFPDVILLAQTENVGFAAANNLGIAKSTGKSILILNPDTEFRPGALRVLWDSLNAASHIGLVAPVLLNADGTVQSAGYRFPGLAQTVLDIFPIHPRLVESSLNGRFDRGDGMTPFAIDHPLGACMLARREVVEQVGDFDESYFVYSEEIDWCQRIKAAGWTVLMAPSAEVIHHGGQSTSQAGDVMREQLHRSRAFYMRRHHPESFHRSLDIILKAGIALKAAGVPLPSNGRSPEDLREIARFYREEKPNDGS